MSRKAGLILVAFIVVTGLPLIGWLAFRCQSGEPPHPIPDGVYLSDSGDERITIEGKRIRFRLHDAEPARREFIELEYDYAVYSDGRVQPHPMSSADALGGPAGRYEWSWDGTVISRRDARDVEPKVTFARQQTGGD